MEKVTINYSYVLEKFIGSQGLSLENLTTQGNRIPLALQSIEKKKQEGK